MSDSKKLKEVLEEIKSSNNLDLVAFDKLTSNEKKIISELYEEGLINEALKLVDELDIEEDWQTLKRKINTTQKRDIPLWKRTLKYAAIFSGIMFGGYILIMEKEDSNVVDNFEESITLQTGSETIKVIREGESQQLVSASGVVVAEQKGNTITYKRNAAIEDLVYSELEIPYGKIFNVLLSDGTLVHLNSGSKLRYPIQFIKGKNREVFIKGEAYFKVAKDAKHPFIVNSDAMAITVLGTEFNISSYEEEEEIKTVLIEGSVSLSDAGETNDNIKLKPGQKAAWNKTLYSTEIEEVDVKLYTSWIDGEMIFRNAPFSDMIKKLERRYNVQIENNNKLLRDKTLNARFNVQVEQIKDVLDYLREIQPFDYTISEQKITIN